MDHDRVGWVSVGREELFAMRRPLNGRDLRRRTECVETSAGSTVPDIDCGVICPTPRCKEGRLPRTPRNGLPPHISK